MKSLIKHKKGQARGIDFMVASILFLLIMTEMMVFTNSMIFKINLQTEQTNTNHENQVLLDSILMSPGSPSTWGQLQSLPNNFIFGLRDSSSISLDATKLSRISESTSANWKLSYSQLVGSPVFADWDIQIQITSPVQVIITSSTLNGAVARVQGYVSYHSVKIPNVEYSSFLVGQDNNVRVTAGKTSLDGSFDISIAGSNLNFYVFVIIARLTPSLQGYAYTIVTNLSPLPAPMTLSTIQQNASLETFGVKVYSDLVSSSSQSMSAFSLIATPTSATYHKNTSAVLTAGTYEASLFTPANGTTVLVGIQYDNTGAPIGYGVRGFPDQIDSTHSQPFTSPSLNPPDQVLTAQVISRSITLIITIRLWKT